MTNQVTTAVEPGPQEREDALRRRMRECVDAGIYCISSSFVADGRVDHRIDVSRGWPWGDTPTVIAALVEHYIAYAPVGELPNLMYRLNSIRRKVELAIPEKANNA